MNRNNDWNNDNEFSNGELDDEEEADDWEDDFDYESFVEENFSGSMTNTETKPLWRFVSLTMLILFVLYAFFAMQG